MNKHPLILAEEKNPSQLHGVCVPVELVAESAAGGENKLPRFKMLAYTGGLMRLAGWWRPVVVQLTGIKAAGKAIPILRQHDPGRIIGHTDIVKIDANGIRVEGVISGTAADAQEVTASSKNGFPWQASIGANPDRVEYVDEGKTVKVNGETFTGPLMVVRAATLFEVSFVPIGADSNTSASVAANRKDNPMTFEEFLKKHGFDKATLSASKLALLELAFNGKMDDAAIAELKASWEPKPAEQPEKKPAKKDPPVTAANDTDATIQANREKLSLEAARVAKIEELCGKQYSYVNASALATIKANAIKEGWSAERVELEIVRADRPQVPAAHIHGHNVSARTIEAAICQSGGLVGLEKAFDAPTLEAAHKQFRGRIGLQELLMQAARANGWSGYTFRGNEQAILHAAFSTIDLGGILTNTANKFLLEGWSMVEDTWRQIAAIRSVTDFKTVTSYRMTGAQQYDEVAPTGEIKHGTLGNESFTNQAKTYGKMLGITRQDQYNDDLSALTSVPKMLGRGGALKLNLVFWTAFMDNSAFFTAGRGNYQSGGTTALSIASLTAAELLFLNQTDSDSKPLGIAPEILLVPNALNTSATSLTRDLELRDTTASTKYTTGNPHAGKFRPVRSSYLSNSSITGYSTAAWYLLANPAALATIEVCFLNGQQNPTIESAAADFNTLGIQLRGYHDFGVTKQEYRAGVKSAGT